MRLKPSPLVDASVVFSIAWLVSLVASVFWRNDFDAALKVSSAIALLFLLPSYTFWALAGLIVRKKSHLVRFFVNLTVSSVIAIVLALVIVAGSGKQLDLAVNGIFMATIYFFGALIGALLTFFLVTRPRKAA